MQWSLPRANIDTDIVNDSVSVNQNSGANSLALLADAGHMTSDAIGLVRGLPRAQPILILLSVRKA